MNSYQLVKIGLTFFKKYIMHQKILRGGAGGGGFTIYMFDTKNP